MIIKNFSDKIVDGGALIQSNNKDNILDLDREKVINLFKDKGFLIFRGYDFTYNQITQFTNKFTKLYANDANRREIQYGNKKIHSVDPGNSEMPLHSEASYSPSWPEIVWFFCDEPPKKSGWTTLCDGIKIYKDMSVENKKFFQSNEIIYDLKIPTSNKRQDNTKIKKSKLRPWFIDQVGVENCRVDLEKQIFYLKQKRYGIVRTNTNKESKLAFVNHLQIILDRDPQLLSWKFENNKKLSSKNLKEIKSICKKNIVEIKWKKKDFCMIDNQRFMHGRTSIKSKEKRKIINVQTLKINF